MAKPKEKFRDLTPRAQQRAIVAQKVATLLAEGVTQAEICRSVGMAPNTLYRLMDDHPEIMKKIHEDVRKRATLSRHRVLTRLEDVLEQNGDLQAALRAGKMIDERAGMSFEQAESGVTVQIFGDTVSVNDARKGDLKAIAMDLAGRLGPEWERVIEAEFTLEPSGEGERGLEGGDSAGTAEDRPAGPGTEADKPA